MPQSDPRLIQPKLPDDLPELDWDNDCTCGLVTARDCSCFDDDYEEEDE